MSDPRKMRRFMERINALPIPPPLEPEQWNQPGAPEEAARRAEEAGKIFDEFIKEEMRPKSFDFPSRT